MNHRLAEIVGKENLLKDVPMSRYTTFRVGGDASYLVNVENEEILIALLKLLKENDVPYYFLGNGSNLLVSDQGYDGVMIKLGGDFSKMIWTKSAKQEVVSSENVPDAGTICQAGAAVMLTHMAQKAAEHDLAGMEFAYGIPGTVGGAIVMNAGAYGGEMCQIVESVRLLNEDLQIVTLKGDEMAFGYRTSILKKKPYVVLSVRLKLHLGDQKEIMAKMNTNMSARKEKQPLEYPSAGSTFKRPEGHFAGKLIQDAGLRGYRVGGAQVSEKHCGFVINTGDATAADICYLIRDVQSKVREMSGIILEPEVIMLGKFPC